MRLGLAAVLAALALVPGRLSGQPAAGEPIIDIFRPEKVVHPIAIQEFQIDGNADPMLARALPAAIARNLEFTGLFRALRPDAYLEPRGKVPTDGRGTRWEDWRVLNASVLVRGAARPDAGKVAVRVTMWNVADGTKIAERILSEPPDRADTLTARVADAVYKALTGEDSFFSSRLAFVNNRAGSKEIFLSQFDGRGEQALTGNRSINLSPAWNGDGTKLAFTSYVRNKPDLYLYDRLIDKFFRISDRPGINIGAAWAPLGRVMAATLSSDGGNPDIYSLGEDGRGPRRLTDSHANDVSPSWSPDGTKIVFVSDRGGSPNLYLMSSGGGPATRLTFGDGGIGKDNQAPAWSPRGDRIAFQSRVDGRWRIFTMKPDGGEAVAITAEGNCEDPSWSPDGRMLAYVRDGKIWVMEADGSNARPVASGAGTYSNVAWSPRIPW